MHQNKKKILTMTSRIDNQLPDAYKYPISKTKKDLIEECKKMVKGAVRGSSGHIRILVGSVLARRVVYHGYCLFWFHKILGIHWVFCHLQEFCLFGPLSHFYPFSLFPHLSILSLYAPHIFHLPPPKSTTFLYFLTFLISISSRTQTPCIFS